MSVTATVRELEFRDGSSTGFYLSYAPQADEFCVCRVEYDEEGAVEGDQESVWIPKAVFKAMIAALGLLGDYVNCGYDIKPPKTDEVPF